MLTFTKSPTKADYLTWTKMTGNKDSLQYRLQMSTYLMIYFAIKGSLVNKDKLLEICN